jgi:hypothetical protein
MAELAESREGCRLGAAVRVRCGRRGNRAHVPMSANVRSTRVGVVCTYMYDKDDERRSPGQLGNLRLSFGSTEKESVASIGEPRFLQYPLTFR